MNKDDSNGYGHYSMVLEWDPVDHIYVVTVSELPGCVTHGSTREEAVRQGQDAIESWIDAAHEWEHSVPSPKYYEIDEIGELHNARQPREGQTQVKKVG